MVNQIIRRVARIELKGYLRRQLSQIRTRLKRSQKAPPTSPQKSEESNHPALSLLGLSGRVGREYTATSVRWTALFWVLFVIALPILYFWALGNKMDEQNRKATMYQSTILARHATPTQYLSVGMVVSTLYKGTDEAKTKLPTQTPGTIEPDQTNTPTPTVPPTRTPTATPDHYEAEEVAPVYWWINYNPPPPGRYSGPLPDKEIQTFVKVSYYYPPLAYVNPRAWINCDKQANGKLECEQMTGGELVRNNVGLAAACPLEWPLGSVIVIGDQKWICKDTGGAIVKVTDNLYWVDLLYPYLPIDGINWGGIVPAKVYVWSK